MSSSAVNPGCKVKQTHHKTSALFFPTCSLDYSSLLESLLVQDFKIMGHRWVASMICTLRSWFEAGVQNVGILGEEWSEPERGKLGGACVIWGSLPKFKALLQTLACNYVFKHRPEDLKYLCKPKTLNLSPKHVLCWVKACTVRWVWQEHCWDTGSHWLGPARQSWSPL